MLSDYSHKSEFVFIRIIHGQLNYLLSTNYTNYHEKVWLNAIKSYLFLLRRLK
jgi:hypothetical protein